MDKTDHPVSTPPTDADAAKDHLQNIAGEASSLLTEAKEQGSEQFEHYRDFAAEQLDTLVEGAQSAASALEGKDSLGLSSYLGDLARYLGEFSHQVRDQSAEQLLQKGTQLARDNPAVFLAGSVAIGFGLSRFLRASSSHGPSSSGSSSGASSSSPPSAYGATKPYQSPVPKTPQVNPGRSSDVSTHEPFTPVDPLGTGVGTPGDGPVKNDPYKGGV
ncbi:hypothetical protein PS627_04010 [Pseudomonas fluorescens]|uniref:hypothetical protein n=1 Tax=Pseudomonas fluorescens TaxID=294 RepID=UPI0012570ACB|nr:hypothetical protein [Pseudomonas fluorescens]CAG8870492.1 hypothetical protein PS627_04010 [Pseudomonas fluorescens]VVP69176.1 hypothetical protein PS910_00530 [Pseudomonas fluorescens]